MVSDSLLSGITLSGGEPFLQPMAALELAQFAKAKGLSVWCYTGYTFEQIREWEDNRKELLKRIDVLVDGRFEQDMASMELDWRGSANQRLINVPESLEKGCVVLYENKRPSKDAYYLDIAAMVARRSTCIRRQYGAVIVKMTRSLPPAITVLPAARKTAAIRASAFERRTVFLMESSMKMCGRTR